MNEPTAYTNRYHTAVTPLIKLILSHSKNTDGFSILTTNRKHAESLYRRLHAHKYCLRKMNNEKDNVVSLIVYPNRPQNKRDVRISFTERDGKVFIDTIVFNTFVRAVLLDEY